MKPTHHTPPVNTLTTPQCDALESLLADLLTHAAAAARLADDHRAAVASADAGALSRCVALQQRAASELAALEARRAALLRSLGLRTAPSPGSPVVTLSQVAALAPAGRAPALTAAAARVRDAVAEAARRRESVRLASLSLMAHMQGMVRQITRYLSDTKTYAPPNRPAMTGGATAGTLDFTS